jgi:hypothetical protein
VVSSSSRVRVTLPSTSTPSTTSGPDPCCRVMSCSNPPEADPAAGETDGPAKTMERESSTNGPQRIG